ncbi:MoaD/ThiS family protein [Endozoicomonas sp. SCSIO W0465]|uniref:MoaD/ThiS family protein n=1 Tax=Endozoicomonas sp. SCSIO W0465 TaxID=2918516 RepID=UPI00207585E6|nr:MoaD/ThiS family protein [Endozoicomonas sp. SCSIO W0465]USE37907.1 MoaD/ThiS family protein [Endozoicomonas sp. SCSIO W0465]
MIKVRFFASFREKLDCEQLTLEEGEYASSLFALKRQLAENGEDWREVMMSDRTLVAINQNMTRQDVVLHCGDEVAFFPPVTGG